MISGPTACNYCAKQIIWLRTRTGAFMPVDAQPAPNGNVLRSGDHAGVLGKNQAAAARAEGAPLHLHHAINCPDASKWQGKGGKR